MHNLDRPCPHIVCRQAPYDMATKYISHAEPAAAYADSIGTEPVVKEDAFGGEDGSARSFKRRVEGQEASAGTSWQT